jgi:hypothetical protein
MNSTPGKVRLQRLSPYANKTLQDTVVESDTNSDDLRSEVRSLAKHVESILRENSLLNEKVDSQARTIESLSLRLNQMEQFSRSDCVEILGIEERQNENCKDLIMGIASASGIHLESRDISTAHRMPNSGGGKRKILARFVGRNTRDQILRAIRTKRTTVTDLNDELKKKGSPQISVMKNRQNIFANENLTSRNRGVFIKALELKKRLKLSSTWTENGITKMRLEKDGPIRIFLEEEDVTKLEDELKTKHLEIW